VIELIIIIIIIILLKMIKTFFQVSGRNFIFNSILLKLSYIYWTEAVVPITISHMTNLKIDGHYHINSVKLKCSI
jgi:hypothetical protein